MNTKYKINDIVYVIDEFRIIKSVINRIIKTEDNNGIHIVYEVYSFSEDKTKAKKRTFIEAQLVATLKEAKSSAFTNWNTIDKRVRHNLLTLTDDIFEPIKNNEDK